MDLAPIEPIITVPDLAPGKQTEELLATQLSGFVKDGQKIRTCVACRHSAKGVSLVQLHVARQVRKN